jgi:hypothetical protein
LVSVVDPVPSVIESPNNTTARVASGAITSTRDKKNHDPVVESTGRSATPVWSPGLDM